MSLPGYRQGGPAAQNVYGRKAGSIPSFKYSDALKGAKFTWDQNSLDRWLTNTESVVPDNDMDFHVPKADERADIIEYLRVSSGQWAGWSESILTGRQDGR